MKFGNRCKFDSIGTTLSAQILSGPVSDEFIATELYGDQTVPVVHSKRDFSIVEVDPAKLLPHWRPYFPLLADARFNELPEGEVIEISGLELDQLGDQASALREIYRKGDEQLLADARKLLASGRQEEEVARWIVKERNNLKVVIRNRGPALFKKIAEWRNQIVYKDKVGPSYEWLVNKVGAKVPPEEINITIIEGVNKTSKGFNAAGKVMKGVAVVAEVGGFVIMATEDSPAALDPLPKSAAEEIDIERARLRLGIPAGANIDRHGHLKPSFYMQVDVFDPHAEREFEAETDEILWALGVDIGYRYGGVEWTVPGR